jgi:hypothetical protein
MQFKLFDALSGGTQIGSTITDVPIIANQGTFAARLDFGANALSGANRWLEIAVRHNSGEGYTILSPLEQIASSPYSVRTLSAASADNALNLGGVAANQFVQTNDPRLSDARDPLPNSSNYIRNTASSQTASFNITGHGTLGGVLTANGNGGTGVSISGVGTSSGGSTGVFGTGNGFGVYGFSSSNTGIGVQGESSSNGTGVKGISSGTGGPGIYGSNSSANGTGIFGTGNGFGVYGFSSSIGGIGVQGESSTGGIGLKGTSNSGSGVQGFASAASGSTYGVYGESASTGGRGVNGRSTAASGAAYGVYGESASPGGSGVYGTNTNANGRGVYGVTTVGVGVDASSSSGIGLRGGSTTGTGVLAFGFNQGSIALKTTGSAWIQGDTSPLSVSQTGSGTGIVMGSGGTLSYISSFDY